MTSQRKLMFFSIVLGSFLLILRRTNASAVITIAPVQVHTSVYTLANFTCKGTGDVLEWTVQGNSLNHSSNQDREISVTTNNISVGVLSSVLTIRALPINDGIIVQCTVISFNPYGFKPVTATLTVKDTLPVENLHFTFNFTSSSWLTWSHPFEKYPLSYHIYIVNQYGQLLYNDITNNTSYELYNVTVCDIYTATVEVTVKVNKRSCISTNMTIQKEYSGEYVLMLRNHTVSFDNDVNKFNVLFSITVIGYPRLCHSTLLGITRENLPNGTETSHAKSNISCSTKDKKSMTVNYTVLNIDPQFNCTFIGRVVNNLNVLKCLRKTLFTTYHVQGLTLKYYSDNGSVVVECRFAKGSTADGCHVIFRESSKEAVKSINMSKSSIKESTVYQYITLPVSGNYTVTAHDIVDGTIITNPSVVYPQVLEYILLLPYPTETVITTSATSSVVTLRDITTSSYLLESTLKSAPSYTINNGSNWIVIGVVCGGGVLVIIVSLVISLVVGCYWYNIKRKQKSAKLNRERALTHYPQTDNNNYEDVTQLPNASTVSSDPYHISADELDEVRRQHQQSSLPSHSHIMQTRPSVDITEHDLLLPESPHTTVINETMTNNDVVKCGCNPVYQNLNHCGTTSDIQEMPPPGTPQQQPVHKSTEKLSSPAVITSSNCGSDSGISSDVTVSRSNSSEESTTTSVISDSNEELNDTSSQYITDQPPMYEVLERLDKDSKTIIPIVVLDNEGSSQFVANKRPHVPQGMDYVQNAIVENVTEYEYSNPAVSSENVSSSSLVNSNHVNLVTAESNDGINRTTNTTSYQEESVNNSLYNFKSEFVSPNPCISQINNNEACYSISNNEADFIEKPEIENSKLELVCTAPQLRNVITQDNNIIQNINNKSMAEIIKENNQYKFSCALYFPLF